MTPNRGDKKYVMKGDECKDIYLQAISMIDPAMGWIETYSVPEAKADLVPNPLELIWLTRYPLQKNNIGGKELLAE